MKYLKILLILLLLLALAPMPFGYYQFVRVAACVVFAILAYEHRNDEQKVLFALYLIGALLFNPIWKVYLGREGWMVADVVWAGILVFDLLQKREKTESLKSTKP